MPVIVGIVLLSIGTQYKVIGQGPTYLFSPNQPVTDQQSITFAGVTLDTTPTPTPNTHNVMVQYKFGTVTGTYTTCTAQAKTSFDGGTTFLTIGTAPALTVTTGTVNAWTVIEQLGTTSVTTSAVSATVALGFGNVTKFTFNCTGAFGTSAPAAISIIAR